VVPATNLSLATVGGAKRSQEQKRLERIAAVKYLKTRTEHASTEDTPTEDASIKEVPMSTHTERYTHWRIHPPRDTPTEKYTHRETHPSTRDKWAAQKNASWQLSARQYQYHEEIRNQRDSNTQDNWLYDTASSFHPHSIPTNLPRNLVLDSNEALHPPKIGRWTLEETPSRVIANH
jgi:hypothetical protein